MSAPNTDSLFAFFKSLGIPTETHSHKPVFSVAEGEFLKTEIPGMHCKSLFFRSRREDLYLVVMTDHKRLNIKGLAHILKVGGMGFASPETLLEKLGVTPGSVTPFALINNLTRDVKVVLDYEMRDQPRLNYHPLRNDQTTTISWTDLLKFITALNYEPHILELPKT